MAARRHRFASKVLVRTHVAHMERSLERKRGTKHLGTDQSWTHPETRWHWPSGVAAVAWRLGMAEIIHMHRTWLQQVLDPDICSGPDRDLCELVDRLEAQLTDAKEGGQLLCAAQIDLSKCFDTVDPQLSIRILRKMGIQETVLGAISSFYRQRRTFMQMGGAVTGPISTKRRLLQGCPASVLLLLVEMNIWIKFVKQSSAKTEVGVYADDRTLWSRGAHARTDVSAAAEASAKYDREAGWKWNEGKGAVIARGKLDETTESGVLEKVGNTKTSIRILGVTLATRAVANIIAKTDSLKLADRQMHRLSVACAGRVQWRRRLKFHKSLTLPKITGGRRFQRPTRKLINKWDTKILRTILGESKGSRAVRTEIIGPEAMLSFGLNSDAVRHEVWRLRRAHLGKPTTHRQHHRWREVCKEWKWTHVEDTIDSDKPPRHHLTPEGVVDLAGDSYTTIKGIAKCSYMARVWGQEKRASDPDVQSQLKSGAQVACQALKIAHDSGQSNGRVATGHGMSHHALRGMRKRAGLEV